jgi:hypothetical protein
MTPAKALVPLASRTGRQTASLLLSRGVNAFAGGACIEVDEVGLQDNHVVWGPLAFFDSDTGDTDPVVPICVVKSEGDRLWIGTGSLGRTHIVPLPPALCTISRGGIYFRGLGDFTEVVDVEISQVEVDGDARDRLVVRFAAGSTIAVSACLAAMNLTFIARPPEPRRHPDQHPGAALSRDASSGQAEGRVDALMARGPLPGAGATERMVWDALLPYAGRIPVSTFSAIAHLNDHDEWGLALEGLCFALVAAGLDISAEERSRMDAAAAAMDLSAEAMLEEARSKTPSRPT